MEVFTYNGYTGSIETSVENRVLHGKLLFVNDLVTYEAKTLDSLEDEFKLAVDDYIETCAAIGKEPQKPLSGQFNVRISPDLHQKLALKAIQTGKSLNAVVADSLEQSFAPSEVTHNHKHLHDHNISLTVSSADLNTFAKVVSGTTSAEPFYFTSEARHGSAVAH